MLYLKTWIKDWKGYSHISTELPWNHAIKLTYGRLSRKRTAWRSNLSGRGYKIKDSHFLRLCLFSLEGDLCTNTQRNTQNKIKFNELFSLLTGLLTGAKQIISRNKVDLFSNLLTTWLLQIRMWSNPFQYATDGVLNILSKWLLMTKIKTIRSNNRHW